MVMIIYMAMINYMVMELYVRYLISSTKNDHHFIIRQLGYSMNKFHVWSYHRFFFTNDVK